MALEDVVPVSLIPNQPWDGLFTDYIVRQGGETVDQSTARATAGDPVLDLIPGSIVNNPNLSFPFTDPSNTNAGWDGYDSNYGGIEHNILIGNFDIMDSSTMTIKIMAGFGGGYQITDKASGKKLLNYFDQGRGEGHSSYSGPLDFVNSNIGGPWSGIGYNGVYDGDNVGHPSHVLGHGKVTINGILYSWVYTQLISWGDNYDRLIPLYVKRWYALDGNKLHIKTKIIHNRADNTTQYGPFKQEWQFMMINGVNQVVSFYNGTNPYTLDGSGARGSTGIESINGGVVREPGNGYAFGVSEGWASVQFRPGRYVGLLSRHRSLSYNQPDYSVYGGEDTEYGNSFVYVGFHPYITLDPFQTWYDQHTVMITNGINEIRQQAAIEFPNTPFSFTFNQSNGRCGWNWYDGATDEMEPFPNGSNTWKLRLKGKSDPPGGTNDARAVKIRSPKGAWKTSDFNTVFVRCKYSGPAPNWVMEWTRVGEEPDNRYQDFPNERAQRSPLGNRNTNQYVALNLINDNQFHTYQINLAGNSYWNGMIEEIDFRHAYSYGSPIPEGELLEIAYISKDNLG